MVDLFLRFPIGLLLAVYFIFVPELTGQWARMPLPPPGMVRPPYAIGAQSLGGPIGFSPAQVRHAYGFDQIEQQGKGQIIGIIDAYDHPNAEADLKAFSEQFGLPLCTTSNGCFRKIAATPYRPPRPNWEWALEIALDIEWAHAIAPAARILLVEASTATMHDLALAVDEAVRNKAQIVSMSFGGAEFSGEREFDLYFAASGVTYVASSGDSGHGAEYPAASPQVVAVGGTTLHLGGGDSYSSESAWNGSGGGLSAVEAEPYAQGFFQLPQDFSRLRGVPDVAYAADPHTGFAVYDSYQVGGWLEVGGTSAGAPQWAGLFALVNSARMSLNKAPIATVGGQNTLYALYTVAASVPQAFHDISSGSNGSCGAACTASPGYDYVTGLGSPVIPSLIPALIELQ